MSQNVGFKRALPEFLFVIVDLYTSDLLSAANFLDSHLWNISIFEYVKFTLNLHAIVQGKSILKLYVHLKPNARDSKAGGLLTPVGYTKGYHCTKGGVGVLDFSGWSLLQAPVEHQKRVYDSVFPSGRG